jgi:hypothetical protein
MPSCTAADESTNRTRMAVGGEVEPGPAYGDETYCAEVRDGRSACPPERCRFGGPEHPKVPTHVYRRPFGLELEGGGGVAPAREAPPPEARPKARKPRKPAARKAARKPAARKAARKPAARKVARRPSRKAPRKARKGRKAAKKR